MEPEVEKLIVESINVNYVDAEQYPSSTEIQNRCVSAVCAETQSLYQQTSTWACASVHARADRNSLFQAA